MAKTDNNVISISVDINHMFTLGTVLLSVTIFTVGMFAGLNSIANALDGGGSSRGTNTRTNTNTDVDLDDSASQVEKLAELADAAGVENVDEFSKCLDEEKYAGAVDADMDDAEESGVSGTPGFVIGKRDGNTIKGYRVSGALPYQVFEDLVLGIKNNDQSKIDGVLNSTTYSQYVFKDATANVENSAYLGSGDRDIVIVEYSDFECPFCQRHHNEEYPTIIDKLVDTGDSDYYFKHLPLSFHEPLATEAAIAAECVREQAGDEGFFLFADLYYENTKSNGKGL